MRYLRSLSGERGQALILFVLGMTIILVAGVITVDVGLWVSERRGASKDADATALAGAWELLDPSATAGDAIAAAEEYLDRNNQEGNASFATEVVVDDSCFPDGRLDAVTTDVNHDGTSLFISLFANTADFDWVPGAHAKACAGAATGLGGVLPFQIDDNPGPCFDTNENPRFTSFCPIELGAQGGNPRGIIDLEAPGDYCSDGRGAGDIEDMIVFGAQGRCFINENEPGSCDPDRNGPWYDCVAVQTGNPKKVLDGVHRRVSQDGPCDANYGSDPDSVDDFEESVVMVFDSGDPFTSTYEARDCDPNTEGLQISPRLVTIIVLEEPPVPGNVGYPIEAFAGMYLLGCSPEGVAVDDQSDTDPYCDAPGRGQNWAPTSSGLFVQGLSAPLPAPVACHFGTPHGNQTCPTPTPTPTPASPTVAPTPTPEPTSGSGPPGHSVVWARFVKLVVTNADVGPPNNQTTLFTIGLVE
jgi:hypothetical protein